MIMWIKLISIKSSFNDQKHKKKTVTARDEKRNKIVFKKMSIKKQNERTLIWMLVELKKRKKTHRRYAGCSEQQQTTH